MRPSSRDFVGAGLLVLVLVVLTVLAIAAAAPH